MRSLNDQEVLGLRLGKAPPKVDSRTLQLRKYLRLPKLPPLKASDDNYSIVPADRWGMLGNDKRGDCVLASAAHHILSMTSVAGVNPWEPTEKQVVDLYDQLSPGDNGLVILDTLNRWRKLGLWGDQITAFFQVTKGDRNELKYAVNLFGGVKIGVALPDVNTFGPWVEITGLPDQNNGHDVVVLGYDENYLYVLSWGKVMLMSWKFFEYYNDEAYGVLSKDFLNAAGLTDEGFDWDALSKDFTDITGEPPIPPPPPPPPGPEPSPSCLQRIFGRRLSGWIARNV